ncbi:hypothetical protein F2Q69_00034242 [Brassica cretica]|uniref:Uncharacterized protein n=1 Tax=Brassica cretica TaxID=69181 RepID=A0A8S9SC52_BRACR|nr:hypothetical protein F2Q69_00034242 [Brassica cretica]
MDPAKERRHSQRQQDHINMLGFMSDSEYGIPKRCPCGGRIIDEVRRKDDYDTLPGKRFFTCKNYEPWVIGVHEEIERLTKRVEEAEQVMLGTSNLSKLIDRLENQVKILSDQVDNPTVQVATLEKVCFE